MFAPKAAVRVTPLPGRPVAMGEHLPFLQSAPARPAANGTDVNGVCANLTARQRDVLALLLQGKSNKAICRVLDLAEPTVKNHVTAILKALKVTNRVEAVIKVSETAVALLAFASTICGNHVPGHDCRQG